MSIARWNHTEPFPNSEVKRCCGHDSLGVALRKNSSMPGSILQTKAISKSFEMAFVFGENHWDRNTICKGIKQLTNGITWVDN